MQDTRYMHTETNDQNIKIYKNDQATDFTWNNPIAKGYPIDLT